MTIPCLTDEAPRLDALHRLQIVDTPAEAIYDQIARFAASICEVPAAAVSFVDHNRQWFKARVGMDIAELPRELSFCSHVIRQPELMVVPDLAADPRFASHPLVANSPHCRFYAGIPILTPDNHCVGTLCVLDYQPHLLSAAQEDALRVLERTLSAHIELRGYALQQDQQKAAARSSAARLERAQEKYRRFFDNAAYGIYQATPRGGLLSANPALARILGYASPEEMLLGVSDIARAFCEDPSVRRRFARLVKSGAEASFECSALRKDGRRAWLSVRGSVVTDGSGRAVFYEGAVEDITLRRELEAEREALLDQTEALLAEALASADDDPLTGLLNHRAFHRRLQEEADRAQRAGASLGIALLDLSGFKFFNDAYGHPVGDRVLRSVAKSLQSVCRSYDTVARFGGDQFAVLLPGATAADRQAATERLASAARLAAFVPPGHQSPLPLALSIGMAFFPEDAAGRMDALALADEEMRRRKTGGGEAGDEAAALCRQLSLSKSGFPMLHSLLTAVDNKDRYTRRHSEDVMAYCLQIARALGHTPRQQETLAVAALLHDVGKIGVPDGVLRKPGPLTEEEFDTMRAHPLMGSMIIAAVPGFEETLDAVRHHHERWDGAGYPFGIAGEDIPLPARIMAVADAFSAMTTDRPYRRGMAREKALAILRAGVGAQWDAACVAAFLQSQSADTGNTPAPECVDAAAGIPDTEEE